MENMMGVAKCEPINTNSESIIGMSHTIRKEIMEISRIVNEISSNVFCGGSCEDADKQQPDCLAGEMRLSISELDVLMEKTLNLKRIIVEG